MDTISRARIFSISHQMRTCSVDDGPRDGTKTLQMRQLAEYALMA